MKSDQEFLEGVYKKARTMNRQSEENEEKTKRVKNNVIVLRLGAAAAILILICSAGVFMQGWNSNAVNNERSTPNVTSFRMELPGGAQQLVQESTEILELEKQQGTGSTPLIHHIYKATVKKEVLLSVLDKKAVTPDPERRLLVFLKIDSKGSEILNVMVEDEMEGTYGNPLAGTITKEELENYISNQVVE